MIMATGVFVGASAVHLITHKHFATPTTIALVAAAASIVIKEGMFRYTRKVGERNNSPAVIANAWDHRSDAYSSVAALAGIIGAKLAFWYLDPIAGLAVSVLIIKMSLALLRPNIGILMDERPDTAILDKITATAWKVSGVRAIDNLRVHRRGSTLTIDIEIAVDSGLTVEQGHGVASEVKNRLLNEVQPTQDVMVHINPYRPMQASDKEVRHAEDR
jgi:cation diffusion facilitator family transporter